MWLWPCCLCKTCRICMFSGEYIKNSVNLSCLQRSLAALQQLSEWRNFYSKLTSVLQKALCKPQLQEVYATQPTVHMYYLECQNLLLNFHHDENRKISYQYNIVGWFTLFSYLRFREDGSNIL